MTFTTLQQKQESTLACPLRFSHFPVNFRSSIPTYSQEQRPNFWDADIYAPTESEILARKRGSNLGQQTLHTTQNARLHPQHHLSSQSGGGSLQRSDVKERKAL